MATKKRLSRIRRALLRRPKEVFRVSVVNQSARSAKIDLIVLHDTEGGNVKGTADLRGVNSWFSNPAAQASAHVTVDAEGNSCRHVRDHRKAWHCGAFNSRALGIEQIGFMTQTRWPADQIYKVAVYLAYWSAKYQIPLKKSTVNGVCQHKDLGVAGGNHGDCGNHYPFELVLSLARRIRRARYGV